MIGWAEAYAQTQWSKWTGQKAHQLHSAMLTASQRGRGRATLLIADGLRQFQVAAKLGWSDDSRRLITKEYQTLTAARSELPAGYAADLPAPLDLVSTDKAVVMFTTAVPGKRPVIPKLLEAADRLGIAAVDQYLAKTMAWSGNLSLATRGERSLESDPVIAYCKRFPERTDAGHLLHHVPADRAWQHGDPAVGNVLTSKRGVRLIDWEHASAESLPFHDLAYLVLVMPVIAARQIVIKPTEAFDALYRVSSWCGDLIRGRIVEAWNHSTPLAAGVAVTALHLAVERGHADSAWLDLAEHVVSMKGPLWLCA